VRLLAERCAPFSRVIERHPFVDGVGHLRMLACEGPTLLAWVGVFQPHCTGRELALFERIAPAIVGRLRLERRVATSGVALAAFDALLDSVAGTAFLVDAGGRVAHANSAGRALLSRDRAQTRAALSDVARSGGERFQVLRLAAPGFPVHLLVLEKAPAPDAVPRAARMAARLGLTVRQRSVLALLAVGKPNKTIAAELGIAESTVELHVSALFARAECRSRAELVARFWTTR
jgi:DNA-binding CsgD family transcriptional regulator